MDIKQLTEIVKKKIEANITLENIIIYDKTFLHQRHKSHTDGKFHLKLNIKSKELENLSKVDGTKKIYSLINYELEHYIHSLELKIN